MEITDLMVASFKGNKDEIQFLIDSGADINLQDKIGITDLMVASFKGNKDEIQFLIDSGADINLQDKKGKTALMSALYNKDKEIVQLLIDSGADIDLQDKIGITALIWASIKGHKEIVQLLIDSGADINLQDKEGKTALIWASYNKDKEMVQLLIDNGADIDLQDKIGTTALIWASYNKDKEMVQLLIDSGADINLQDKIGITALIGASIKGHKEIVQLLIDSGADINTKNLFGETSLIIASENGNKEVVQLLIDNGADINLQDKEGKTALIWVSIKGHKEIVQLLIDSGADINLQDKIGMTALICASIKGHKEIVQLLIDNGADIDLQDKIGTTALIWASIEGHKEIVQLLIDSGADIEIKSNNFFSRTLKTRVFFIKNKVLKLIFNILFSIFEPIGGKTALMLASENGHKSIVKLLVENGANIEYLKYKEKKENELTPIQEKIIYGIFSIFKLIFLKTPIYNNFNISKEDILNSYYKDSEIKLDNFILHYKYLIDEKQTMSNPKKLVNILSNFTKDTPIKYSTHLWDFRSLKDEYGNFKGFINSISNQLNDMESDIKGLSPILYRKIYDFLLNKNPTKSWCSKANITIGWSSLEGLENWCNSGKNPFDFELEKSIIINNNQTITTFGEVINLFKQEIEIRNDNNMLENIFLVQKRKLGRSFKMELIKLKGRSFYTDVESFTNSIDRIFEEIKKRDNHKNIRVEVIEVNDNTMEIVIAQLGSKANRSAKEMIDEIKDGDFKMIKDNLQNLCDWSIESSFENKSYKIIYLPEIKKENIETSLNDFKHILRFYK